MEKRYSRTRITKQAAEDGRKRLLLKRKKEDSEDEKKDLIVVRGAGDLATGTIHRLKKRAFVCWFWKQSTRRRSGGRWL